MKIYLSKREDRCKVKKQVRITGGNVIENKIYKNYLVGFGRDYKNYAKDRHPENIVNVRIILLKKGQKDPNEVWFSYLNPIKKFRLKWMRNVAWIQNRDNISLLISFIAIGISVIALLKTMKVI